MTFADQLRPHFDSIDDVFGVTIAASRAVGKDKRAHAAAILSEYLDNNEDGIADNPAVVRELKQHNAAVLMYGTPEEADAAEKTLERSISEKDFFHSYHLFDDETRPEGSSPDGFDAALEEILHLVTETGYAFAYPEVFGMEKFQNSGATSKLQDAMDIARGGSFRTVPKQYPDEAWYRYDDRSCDYQCQTNEYIYWGLTSLLGGQNYPGRGDEIFDEWQLNTPDKFAATDKALHKLLTDPNYAFPTTLPDGSYSASTPDKDSDELTNSTIINAPTRFRRRAATRINNFNPEVDTIQLNTDSFETAQNPIIAFAKNKKEAKQSFARDEVHFIYESKKGGLYFNENGTDRGFGDGGLAAIIQGAPSLNSDHFEAMG